MEKLVQFNFIVYNTEQLANKNSIVRDIKQADHVWDYSFANLKHIQNKSKFHVPLGYSKGFCIDNIKPNRNNSQLNYFGTTNACRRIKISAIKELDIPFKKNDNVFFGRWNTLVQNEQCYINIHYFPKTALEVFRIVPLLCNGCCVFSERSDDKELDALYEPYITFYDDIKELIGFTVNNKALNFTDLSFQKFIQQSGCLETLTTKNVIV